MQLFNLKIKFYECNILKESFQYIGIKLIFKQEINSKGPTHKN